jgi:hypothetical protein
VHTRAVVLGVGCDDGKKGAVEVPAPLAKGGVFRCGPELLARSVVDARWGVLGLRRRVETRRLHRDPGV